MPSTPFTKEYKPANPAAGANFSQTVPAGVTWIVTAIDYQIVTSATVANRNAAIVITDPVGSEVAAIQVAANQVASTTWTYVHTPSWAGADVNVGARVTATLPDDGVPLQPGSTVKSAVAALQAGDQIQNIVITVVEQPVVPGYQL